MYITYDIYTYGYLYTYVHIYTRYVVRFVAAIGSKSTLPAWLFKGRKAAEVAPRCAVAQRQPTVEAPQ